MAQAFPDCTTDRKIQVPALTYPFHTDVLVPSKVYDKCPPLHLKSTYILCRQICQSLPPHPGMEKPPLADSFPERASNVKAICSYPLASVRHWPAA